MEENKKSKGYKEIFEEKYPAKDVAHNKYCAIEAHGYLTCLESFLPSETWIKEAKTLCKLSAILNIASED